MTQIALALEFSETSVTSLSRPGAAAQPAARALDAWEADGFAIGWDHGRYGVMPPVDHLHPGHPVRLGWDAYRARGLATPRPRGEPMAAWPSMAWLSLRLTAWLRAMPFETVAVTVSCIRRLRVTHCPVTRQALTWQTGQDSDAQVMVLNEAAGVAAGNLAVVSARAAQARARCADVLQVLTRGQAMTDPGQAPAGLDAQAWRRLAGLISLATPAPHAQVSARALTVFPPPRVRVLNPAQAVQTMLSSLWMAPGYARRLADMAADLPQPMQRRRLSLFMSALLARRLQQGWSASAQCARHALEEAWGHPAVLSRWQDFMQCLDAQACERWVRRVMSQRSAMPGLRWMDNERATEGWAIGVQPSPALAASPAPVVVDDQRCVV